MKTEIGILHNEAKATTVLYIELPHLQKSPSCIDTCIGEAATRRPATLPPMTRPSVAAKETLSPPVRWRAPPPVSCRRYEPDKERISYRPCQHNETLLLDVSADKTNTCYKNGTMNSKSTREKSNGIAETHWHQALSISSSTTCTQIHDLYL
jgi:hypothetical protein